jgi:hypothetical protein
MRGDWFDASVIYRDWVEKEAMWWPDLGSEGRPDTPMWMRELPAWALGGGHPSHCVPRVKRFAKELGVPVGFHWYNWHRIPFDNDYPHYFPAKDGFAKGISALQEAGVHVMPYINGRLWDTRDKGTKDWRFTRVALPAATKDDSGKPYTEAYGSKEADGSPVRLAPMCPHTQLWQNRVSDIVLRLFTRCGVHGVYIDQVAAARPQLCFDADHGHPLGGGHWWIESYGRMLGGIRAQKPRDRMLTTECNAEPYVKWFDGYLTWHWQEQNMVPAFPAVYGGALQLFGRAYRGGPTQDLANRMKAGQQMVFGEQIGWIDPAALKRKDSGPFLRDVVHLRWLLRRYFYAGRMVRPPGLAGDIPTVTADWQWRGKWPITTPAVMTGAWHLPLAGSTALLLANVSDRAVKVGLTVDAEDYGLPGGKIPAWTIRPGGAEKSRPVDLGKPIEVTLGPRSILAWEVSAPKPGRGP